MVSSVKQHEAVPQMQTYLLGSLNGSMGLTRILMIQQDAGAVGAIATELWKQGYQVDTVMDSELEFLTNREAQPDLVIVDGSRSKLSSIQVCRRLRRWTATVPIILLANLCEPEDSMTGFEAGADDCIEQPFTLEELLVRIRVRLRFAQREKPPILQFHQLTLDCQKREAYWNRQAISLTAKEFNLLQCLIIHYPQVVSRYELMERLWGDEYDVSPTVIDTYICRLRLKLEQYTQMRLIKTIHRVGYTLQEPS